MPRSRPTESMHRTTPEATGRLLGVAIAALASGPIFVALAIPQPAGPAGVLSWPLLWGMLSFATVLTTAPIAMLPIGAAVWLGGWLGGRARLFRHPLVWAAVGAVGGMVVAPWLTDTFGIAMSPLAQGLGGMLVSLVARRFVAWID